MGRSGPGILDLLSSIGLRAPYTKCASDWKASEEVPVKEFYNEKIPNLCELHFTKSNDEILHGSTTRHAAVALFAEYGPRIWSRAKHRPWLFNPGEITKHAQYTRKLYFDVPEDCTFLKERVCELVIERIFRHHKEHISKTRAPSVDGSWRSTPAPAPTTRSTRNSLSTYVPGAVCFSGAFGLAAHQDASALQEQGVWLGDYDEEKVAVNGASYDDVQHDYFFQTDAGKRKAYDEPYVFDEATETNEDYLLCAGCQNGALLKIECHEFKWEDEDSETVMTKNVWAYPCKLGDRKVFALIKPVPQIQTNTGSVWGFWRVDGGYTHNLLLASRSKATASLAPACPSPRLSPPKRSSDGTINDKRAKQAKQDHFAQEMEIVHNNTPRTIDSTSSGPSVVPREWAPVNLMTLTRQSDGSQAISSKAYGKLPVRNTTKGADYGTQLRPSPVKATARSINDDENLYDVTPHPERRSTQQGFFKPYTVSANDDASVPTSYQLQDSAAELVQEQQLCQQRSHHHSQQRDSPTIRQESTPSTRDRTARAPPYYFRYFVTATWTQNQNIIKLDDTMDVQAVYSRVQRTLNRKLEGSNVASLSFVIQDEEPIDVEIDDGDAWETVLDMLKDAKLFAVKGTVSRSD